MKIAAIGAHVASSTAIRTPVAGGNRSYTGRSHMTTHGESACTTPPIAHPIAACEQTVQAIGLVTRHPRRLPKNRTPSVSIHVRVTSSAGSAIAPITTALLDRGTLNASVSAASPPIVVVDRTYHSDIPRSNRAPNPIHIPTGTTVASNK